jgi:hypothetical protein
MMDAWDIEELARLYRDALTLALRLMGEDESTFSPETAAVMDRWRPRCMEALQKAV